jgi:hypothetical protein
MLKLVLVNLLIRITAAAYGAVAALLAVTVCHLFFVSHLHRRK